MQGRKMYAVPASVSKSGAVRMLVDRLGIDLLVAAGDSLLDRDLLDIADVSIRPRHGELHAAAHPTHVVTSAAGIAAAEEILDVVGSHLRER